MGAWDEVLRAVMVGTERRPAPRVAADGDLGELLERLPEDGSERTLLDALSVLAIHRLCGRMAPRAPARLPAPADDETRSVASEEAARLLPDPDEPGRAAVVEDWLDAAAAAGRLAPPDRLPDLLDLGRGTAKLRSRIRPVLGARGRWLASLRSEWSWAFSDGASDDDVWITGALAARAAFLAEERRRDPAAARARLEAVFSSLPAKERRTLLGALEETLGPDDEPFLEATLDDRAATVRREAAALLGRLPDSRRAARMVARLRDRLQLANGTLRVDPPDAIDEALARDGVEDRAQKGEGHRAAWLRQMAAAASPTRLAEALGAAPEQCLPAVRASDWAEPLLRGLLAATAAQRDEDFAGAFLADLGALDADAERTCLEALPAARREEVVAARLRVPEGLAARVRSMMGRLGGDEDRALERLSELDHRWSPDFSAHAMRYLAYRVARSPDRALPVAVTALERAAGRADPGAAAPVLRRMRIETPGGTAWARPVLAAAETIAIRLRIARAFSEKDEETDR